MSGFSRFSESDYRRLSECDRWTVAETANFIIEAKKNIDGSVGSPGYDADCQEMFVGYLNNVFVFWRSKKDLKVYGPAGDLGSPLIEDREVFSQCGLDEWGLDATSFFMKKDVLAILRKSNPSVFTYIEDKLSSNADNSILPQFSACHESLSRAKLYDNKNDSDSPKGPDRVKGEARIDSEIREFSNESVTVGILSEEAPSPAVVSGEVIESSLQPGKGPESVSLRT